MRTRRLSIHPQMSVSYPTFMKVLDRVLFSFLFHLHTRKQAQLKKGVEHCVGVLKYSYFYPMNGNSASTFTEEERSAREQRLEA